MGDIPEDEQQPIQDPLDIWPAPGA